MTAGGSRAHTPATLQPPSNDACLAEFVASRQPIDASTHVVLGNEAADLDSVSCAIVLAYLLDQHERQQQPGGSARAQNVVPMVNVRKSELPLRRDVLLALGLAGIDKDKLVYRDTPDVRSCGSLTLVDHNAATDPHLSARVRSVFDHHADEGNHRSASPRVVDTVGSCSTLVAERAVALGLQLTAAPATMLLAAILLDCHNMDPSAGKATPRDEAMADALAVPARVPAAEERDALFKRLKQARKDIDGFSAFDLMRKDAKVVRGAQWDVAICSIGVSPHELMQRAQQDGGLGPSERKFSYEWGVSHSILMLGYSSKSDGGYVRKIVMRRGDATMDAFYKEMVRSGGDIGVVDDKNVCDGFRMVGQDARASRKKVLPLVRSILAENDQRR